MHLNGNIWCPFVLGHSGRNLKLIKHTPFCNAVALPHGGSVVHKSCTTAPFARQACGLN